jgi:hypothetical protein
MDAVHTLMANATECFKQVLSLLCNGQFDIHPAFSENGGQFSIALVVSVTQADEEAMQGRGDDVALETLAHSVGVHSGTAEVSFQFE